MLPIGGNIHQCPPGLCPDDTPRNGVYIPGWTPQLVASARPAHGHNSATDQQVAKALMVGPATVGRVRQRFVEGGLERALDDLPRPGQRRKLDGKQQAHLVAVACSAAPEGHTRWTLRLLADEAVKLELTDSISRETVRQVLKKTSSSRGGRRSGASPR